MTDDYPTSDERYAIAARRHNHATGGFRLRGECPACDALRRSAILKCADPTSAEFLQAATEIRSSAEILPPEEDE